MVIIRCSVEEDHLVDHPTEPRCTLQGEGGEECLLVSSTLRRCHRQDRHP